MESSLVGLAVQRRWVMRFSAGDGPGCELSSRVLVGDVCGLKVPKVGLITIAAAVVVDVTHSVTATALLFGAKSYESFVFTFPSV